MPIRMPPRMEAGKGQAGRSPESCTAPSAVGKNPGPVSGLARGRFQWNPRSLPEAAPQWFRPSLPIPRGAHRCGAAQDSHLLPDTRGGIEGSSVSRGGTGDKEGPVIVRPPPGRRSHEAESLRPSFPNDFGGSPFEHVFPVPTKEGRVRLQFRRIRHEHTAIRVKQST